MKKIEDLKVKIFSDGADKEDMLDIFYEIVDFCVLFALRIG